MPNKTFVDIFSLVCCNICFMELAKKIFLNPIAAILELAAIATLKRKIRDGNIPSIIEYILIKVFRHVACF